MTLDDIKEQPPGVLDALPIAVLANLQTQAEAHLADASQMVAILHSTFVRRYADGLNGFGTTTRTDGDFEIKINVPKNVAWDQVKIAEAVETIKGWGENPDQYVDTKITVSETKYKAWPDSISQLFEPARTEKAGKPTFKIMEKESA
ncbi:MAG: hypothetical protein V4657_09335 [Pseudomonadota bacterium]